MNFPQVTHLNLAECNEPTTDPSQAAHSWQYLRIEAEVVQASGDLMICDVDLILAEIVHLSEAIKPRAQLAEFLVPGAEKMAAMLAEGQLLYRHHNRWLDYPPGYIEDVHSAFVEKLKALKTHLAGRETRVIET